jgi:hypothetical protein
MLPSLQLQMCVPHASSPLVADGTLHAGWRCCRRGLPCSCTSCL